MTHELRSIPSLDALKDQAKRLRFRLVSEGKEVSHSKSLELIAAQYAIAIGTHCTRLPVTGLLSIPGGSARGSEAVTWVSLSKRRSSRRRL